MRAVGVGLLAALFLALAGCGPGGTTTGAPAAVSGAEDLVPHPPAAEVQASSLVETDSELPYDETALSEAPFTGPCNNGLIGLGRRGPWTGLFSAEERPAFLEGVLRWLAAQQHTDGGWDELVTGLEEPANDPGLTGRVLLAFQSVAYTNRGRHPYAKVVGRGLRFLKRHQAADGWFVVEEQGGWKAQRDLMHHGPACAAMVEAYAQTHSPIFRASAVKGLDALAAACAAEDGQLREPRSSYAAFLALRSARRANRWFTDGERSAPFDVSAERFESLARQRFVTSGGTEEDVAIAVLARAVFDDPADARAPAERAAPAQELRARPGPAWTTDLPAGPPLRWALVHAAIQVTPEAGDRRGQAAARTALLDHLAVEGLGEEAWGSWDPNDLPAYRDGRVRLTALCVAALWRIRP